MLQSLLDFFPLHLYNFPIKNHPFKVDSCLYNVRNLHLGYFLLLFPLVFSPSECQQWRTVSNRGWSWKASTRSIHPCTSSSPWPRWVTRRSPAVHGSQRSGRWSERPRAARQPLSTDSAAASFCHVSYVSYRVAVQVCGYRLRLHFDGYSDCHDFWVNANSPDIHAAGWCESTGHKLHTPKGQRWRQSGDHRRLTQQRIQFFTIFSVTSSLYVVLLGLLLKRNSTTNYWFLLKKTFKYFFNYVISQVIDYSYFS